MPRVFISYAQADFDAIAGIESGLQAAGVAIWRDQEKLRAGQRWPQALGEAIAAQEGVLLFWSEAAEASAFVEMEWNTALALRKPILPCLLDDTPLPASLSALQAVDARRADALARILSGLQAPPPAPPVKKRSRFPAGLPWIGLIAAWLFWLASPAGQSLYGAVWDEQGQPVAGAQVVIIETGQTVTAGPTGAFQFTLRGAKEVRLLAKKPGYAADPQFASAGAKVDLTLRKAP